MRQVFPRTTTETQQVRHNQSNMCMWVPAAAQNRVCLCSHHQTGLFFASAIATTERDQNSVRGATQKLSTAALLHSLDGNRTDLYGS